MNRKHRIKELVKKKNTDKKDIIYQKEINKFISKNNLYDYDCPISYLKVKKNTEIILKGDEGF
ncbi:MAG: hypothetical protein ACOCRK_01595 [bacterium]